VNTGLAILFLAVGGFLLGGVWSMHQQDKSLVVQVVLAVLGVLSAVVGVLYLT
jgi:hypothetical protein